MENLKSLKIGIINEDFVRLCILTKINNGTPIGSFSSIATDALIHGRIPEVSRWADSAKSKYEIEKAALHGSRQMARKDKSWDEHWENALRQREEDQAH